LRVITDRELQDNCAELLRAVRTGEIIQVTSYGSAAAILIPPSLTPYERLVAVGKVRVPDGQQVDLRRISRMRAGSSSAEIITDTRGRY
jgi:antitoxin (DNA-binding transcriptional repressor) of toxin-antitoxin stability system